MYVLYKISLTLSWNSAITIVSVKFGINLKIDIEVIANVYLVKKLVDTVNSLFVIDNWLCFYNF